MGNEPAERPQTPEATDALTSPVTPNDIAQLAETRHRDPHLALQIAGASGDDWDAIVPYGEAK